MVIDFSKIDYNNKPTLILKNLDGTAIQTLGYALNVEAELSYNELSTLTFDLPAEVEGKETPHYEDVVGMRIIDLYNIGQFILVNPEENSDGIKTIKSCKAYSLEYEFTKKTITLQSGTYKFWDNDSEVQPNTMLGRILEKMPDWSVGVVDTEVAKLHRTFEVEEDKIYDFIKSEVQESYGCIFEFDTYNRTINVVSVSSPVETKPIYLSKERLIKEIEVEENSDEIVTCLDVRGADNVDIRSINPTGSNKIYNLDYFMNTTNFTQEFIDKWEAWKQSFEDSQQPYFDLSMDYNIQLMKKLTEEAKLTDLQGELSNLESQKAVTVQAIAQSIETNSALRNINRKIADKENEISNQKAVISAIETKLNTLQNNRKSIAQKLAFDYQDTSGDYVYFNPDEQKILQRYFIEDSLQDSSFVAASTETYNNEDISNAINGIMLNITDSDIESTSRSGKTMKTIRGGTLEISSLTATIIRGTAELNTDKSVVFTAYLDGGTIGSDATSFKSGTVTIIGDYVIDKNTGNTLTFRVDNGTLYFTKNTSDYEQHMIEWDLYEYGKQVLEQKASPTYEFSIESGNFLAIEDFISFKNALTLGKRVYLKMANGEVLQPYVVTVNIDFENFSEFSLEFSSTYTTFDKQFKLANLLDQSVSMGKSLNAKSGVYSEFVNSGASNTVKEFMDSALDVAKNRVLSSGKQAMDFSDAGLRIRKWTDDSHTAYDPEQIWIVDNMIAFTTDNWATSNMAIGKIFNENYGSYIKNTSSIYDSSKSYYYRNGSGTTSDPYTYTYYSYDANTWNTEYSKLYYRSGGLQYGIAAPYLVGNILAGQQCTITTNNGSFRVDESGVYIDSLKFYITHGGNTYDTTLSEEIQNLQSADDKAAEDLADAIKTIDGKIEKTTTTYYQSSQPESPNNGDLWYNTSAETLWRYDGSSWQQIDDAKAKQAIRDAQTAQATADSKIVTYYQEYPPEEADYGDLWYNSNKTKIARRHIRVGDKLTGVTLYFDTSVKPNSVPITNFILSNSSNRYIGMGWNGSNYNYRYYDGYRHDFYNMSSHTWVCSQYTLGDFGIVKTVDTTHPFYELTMGDFEQDYEPEKLYRYNGNTWQTVQDGEIETVKQSIKETNNTIAKFLNADKTYLDATKMSGVIDSTLAQMASSKGNVLFDKDGIWLLNTTSKNTATKAVWLNEAGIALGSGVAGDPTQWDWSNKTVIDQNGIVAQALAGKYLSGCEIFGGSITIKDSNGRNIFSANPNGVTIGEKNNRNVDAKFYGTVQAREYLDLDGKSMMTSDSKFDPDYLELKGITIKKGDTTTFAVDDGGTVTINGQVTMGAGSTINWNSVSESNYTNSQAYKRANTAIAQASTAQTTANDLNKDLLSLINGTYEAPKSTFIDGKTIKSPTISAGTMNSVTIKSSSLYSSYIYGANYYDVNKIGKLVLSTTTEDNISYADLNYYRVQDSQSLFGIKDNGDYTTSLWLYGRSIGYGSKNAFFPTGTWNFDYATVTNLKTTAKFG